MRIKILGCSGGIGAGLRTTAILINDEVLIDTGTGIGDLTLDQMRKIRNVFLTHSHMDHTCGLPLLVDTIFETLLDSPLDVIAQPKTMNAVKKHIFNWILWPDFSSLPTAETPVMRYRVMNPGTSQTVAGIEFTMIEVNHTVPGVGYIAQKDGKYFAFSGDTTTNDNFWNAVNELPRLDLLVVETAFSNRNEELAWLARHYCPKTLAFDLRKLKHDPAIWITHLKPGAETEIFKEIEEEVTTWRVKRLMGGEEFEL
ncbi:MAG: 3',5'-cyclic-nucleotide phosphodiesterase [Gammaproteobacteria bacterium]